jgi:hypothetical protein
VGICYFHVRDELGMAEDPDGIGLPNMAPLSSEVIRSANELSLKASAHRNMQFEITDADGRTVLVTLDQESMTSWELMARLPAARKSMQ